MESGPVIEDLLTHTEKVQKTFFFFTNFRKYICGGSPSIVKSWVIALLCRPNLRVVAVTELASLKPWVCPALAFFLCLSKAVGIPAPAPSNILLPL